MHFDAFLLFLLSYLGTFVGLPSASALRLTTFFTPLDIETLESVKIEQELGLSCRVASEGPLKGVDKWKTPNKNHTFLADRQFAEAFLPLGKQDWTEVQEGESWKVLDVPSPNYEVREPANWEFAVFKRAWMISRKQQVFKDD